MKRESGRSSTFLAHRVSSQCKVTVSRAERIPDGALAARADLHGRDPAEGAELALSERSRSSSRTAAVAARFRMSDGWADYLP